MKKNKEQLISQQRDKIHCNICNSLKARDKVNRHQDTKVCEKKSLLLNEAHIDKQTQLKEQHKEHNKRYYESNKEKVISQHNEKYHVICVMH